MNFSNDKAPQLFRHLLQAMKPLKPRKARSLSIDGHDFSTLDRALIKAREGFIAQHCQRVDFEKQAFRVFYSREKNLIARVEDIEGRELDFIRAALHILQYAHKPGALPQLKNILSNLHKALHFEGLSLSKGASRAQKINYLLCDLLVEQEVCKTHANAKKAIAFMADFLWQRDFNQLPWVSVSPIEAGLYHFKINRAMQYNPSLSGPCYKRLWENLSTKNPSAPEWYQELAKQTAPPTGQTHWLDRMVEDALALESMKRQSPSAMSRFSPNAANSYRCEDVIATVNSETDQILHHSQHDKTAITEPLAVGHTDSSDDIQFTNHFQMVFTPLKENLKAYFKRFGPLLDKNRPIPFTILHQTLVSDEVNFVPDVFKIKRKHGFWGAWWGSNYIDTKHTANRRLEAILASYEIYYHPETDQIKILKKGSPSPGKAFCLMDIQLKESNHCVNVWHWRSRVRDTDMNTPRQLIKNTDYFLKQLEDKVDANLKEDLSLVRKALSRSNFSWLTAHFDYAPREKQAFARLCKALKRAEVNGVERNLGENLSLLIQASAQLKRTVHETRFGAFRRQVENRSRGLRKSLPYLGHLADWTLRGVFWGVATLIKVVTEPLKWLCAVPMWLWNRATSSNGHKFTSRPTHARAKYEGLVAELLGQLFGGCMSSLDRANELSESRAAEKALHITKGYISSYNTSHSQAVESQYQSILNTKHKHNAVFAATGIQGTQDLETVGLGGAGLAAEKETREEKQQSRTLARLRKFSFKKPETGFFCPAKQKDAQARPSKSPICMPSI